MEQSKTDPRVLRTRKLIMDSFMELSSKKEFKDITVKDITAEAVINRATFYYHFEDIYDLLEKVLSEVLLVNLDGDYYQNYELNEEALINIFKAITNFQKSLSNRCHRGYEDTIARIIREQLEVIFHKMLLKQRPTEDVQAQKVTAVMLSWGIYGASVEWRRSSKEISPEEYIHSAIPYIMKGIDLGDAD
ncbi:TetR family transcriptional regulator [Oceanobacillus arenosus]|uniref:TetR family transcriptional regulator n=1 Tax=Oceanobacillus arenosus TaxID=1229153 RepID=A0A3D8Q1Z2_9BACI|nr:TetR/AcrR family transcriptional regulator [Oceanobacillus arenosus]RDW21867.1 TetR family transcriptional regulator [Oceanobacillus arenosus]